MRPDRDDLLARIYDRGRELHRRRQALLGSVAAVVVVVAGLGILAVTGDDGDRSDVATEGGPTTSRASDGTATTVREDESIVVDPTGSSTTIGAPPTTTTTLAPCRNSEEPRCGDWYYDYPAPNTPPTITLSTDPKVIRVDEPVTLTITYHDPDGPPVSRCESISPGFDASAGGGVEVIDGTYGSTGVGTGICGDGRPTGHGPWDPPPPEQREVWLTVVYRTPGPRVVGFASEEGGRCPEGNQAHCDRHVTAEFPVEVLPAP